MSLGFLNFLTILGALGLFMFGMKTSSEAIQRATGSRMRNIINRLTSNRISGATTGLVTTFLIQTSTATTVLVVGFVNAGIIQLRQAISLIIGANIGTTIKAWLFAYTALKINIDFFGLIGVGLAFPFLFSKRGNSKTIAEAIIGFSLMFIALGFIRNVSENLQDNEIFLDLIRSLSGHGFLSILLALFAAMTLTMVVQSSSVMMAFTLVLTQKGIISFEIAAAMVLGENIGTTITANIAALVANRNAKRAALSHTLFNVLGVILILPFFYNVLDFINWIILSGSNAESSFINSNSAAIGIAIMHTGFNLFTAIFALSFLEKLELLTTRMIPLTESEKEDFRLEVLQQGMIQTPELLIMEANHGIDRLVKINKEMLQLCDELLTNTKTERSEEIFSRLKSLEDTADKTAITVSDYLGKITGMEISRETSLITQSLIRIVKDLEDLADVFFQISKVMERKYQEKIWFNPEQRNNLRQLLVLLKDGVSAMKENLHSGYGNVDLSNSIEIEDKINFLRNKFKSVEYTEQTEDAFETNQRSTSVYIDLLNFYEKAGDFIVGISKCLVHTKNQHN